MGQAIDDTRAYRISDGREHDGQSAAEMLQSCHGYGAAGQDDVGREREQFRSIFCAPVGVVLGPADVDPHITSNIPAQFLQALVERCKSILTFRVVRSPVHEDTNPPRTFWLLRTRRQRPRRRAAEKRDEVAPLCMTRKEHTERWRGSVHETASAATGSPQPLWTLVRE